MRPKIALAFILKNEKHNLPGLLKSVEGCFDAIFATDTGSTDGSIEFLQSELAQNLANAPIHLSHFEWCEDFSKARNYNFDQVPEGFDYIMWLDCDDMLSDKEAFKHFRDHVLHTGDCWHAIYEYALNEKGESVCSFIRERVVRRGLFRWQYFIHEGLVTDKKDLWVQKIGTWTVKHMRSEMDKQVDWERNLRIFGAHADTMDSRMLFYWGKEAFDHGQYHIAIEKLSEAVKDASLQPHDRIMGLQYLCAAEFQLKNYAKSTRVGLMGIQIVPSRAEIWCTLGDCATAEGRYQDAIQYYRSARCCIPNTLNDTIFCVATAYGAYPTYQLAQIYGMFGDGEKLEKEICRLEKYGDTRTDKFKDILSRIKKLSTVRTDLPRVREIAITTPPGSVTSEWDDVALKTQGLGGSETAAVELAKFLKRKTGLPVRVFNNRKDPFVSEDGVTYLPLQDMENYFTTTEPLLHIAWRHSAKITNARTLVWSHDLITPGAENTSGYDKYVTLSEFHKNFVHGIQGVPFEKIAVWRNGIDPDLWNEPAPVRNPMKVIFSSSPDRGLDRCIHIVKKAREISGLPIELHLFYGFENMKKDPRHAETVKNYEKLINDNKDFVHYYGSVDKPTLIRHFRESAAWCYPSNFIETFAITALEAACSGAYSIARNMGALPNTMKDFLDAGMAELTDVNASNEQEYEHWAHLIIDAIKQEKWKRVSVDRFKYSWEAATEEFIEKFLGELDGAQKNIYGNPGRAKNDKGSSSRVQELGSAETEML